MEYCIEGSDIVEMRVAEPFSEAKVFKFRHPKAREVFDAVEELVRGSLLC